MIEQKPQISTPLRTISHEESQRINEMIRLRFEIGVQYMKSLRRRAATLVGDPDHKIDLTTYVRMLDEDRSAGRGDSGRKKLARGVVINNTAQLFVTDLLSTRVKPNESISDRLGGVLTDSDVEKIERILHRQIREAQKNPQSLAIEYGEQNVLLEGDDVWLKEWAEAGVAPKKEMRLPEIDLKPGRLVNALGKVGRGFVNGLPGFLGGMAVGFVGREAAMQIAVRGGLTLGGGIVGGMALGLVGGATVGATREYISQLWQKRKEAQVQEKPLNFYQKAIEAIRPQDGGKIFRATVKGAAWGVAGGGAGFLLGHLFQGGFSFPWEHQGVVDNVTAGQDLALTNLDNLASVDPVDAAAPEPNTNFFMLSEQAAAPQTPTTESIEDLFSTSPDAFSAKVDGAFSRLGYTDFYSLKPEDGVAGISGIGENLANTLGLQSSFFDFSQRVALDNDIASKWLETNGSTSDTALQVGQVLDLTGTRSLAAALLRAQG